MRHVAFLRGVNVGGRIIRMADLKICFEKMGFKNVQTLLQSGNVVFEASGNEAALKKKIEAGLSKNFNYPAKVIVVSMENLRKIVDSNPFKSAPADYHQYVIFFEGNLAKDFAAEEVDSADEAVKAGQGVAYWKVQKSQTLKSTRGKLLGKAKYREFNTNRNINTLRKILAI